MPKTCSDLVVNEDNPYLDGAAQGAIVTSFTAKATDSQVLLEWEASIESNVRGYNILRGTSPDAINEQVNSELISAQSSSQRQAISYQFTDESAEAGITYYYQLNSVDENGTTQILVESPTAIIITTLTSQPTSPNNDIALPMLSLIAIAGLWLGYRRWEEVRGGEIRSEG